MLGSKKQEQEQEQKPIKKYQTGIYNIYQFNNRKYVIATSLEEAIVLFKDYQEKDDDTCKGKTINIVELISDNTLSKNDEANIVEL